MLSPTHLRAARALLDWTRDDVKAACGISPETVKNIEHGVFKPKAKTYEKIIRAFSERGVEFLCFPTFSKFDLDVIGVVLIARKDQTPDEQKPATPDADEKP